jgi:hypothetical protein
MLIFLLIIILILYGRVKTMAPLFKKYIFSQQELQIITPTKVIMATTSDEGTTPRVLILAYLVPAKEEARSKDT